MIWMLWTASGRRRRVTLLAALVVLGACSARQTLAVPGEPPAPVVSAQVDLGDVNLSALVRSPGERPAPARATPSRSQRQPPPPSTLTPLVVTQVEREARQTELDRVRVSVLIGEPIPLTDLFLLLVRDTDISIVPDPGIDGSFVGELKDVTVRQALDHALSPHHLEYAVEDGVVRIFPRRPLTRVFELGYVPTRRIASGTTTARGTGDGDATSGQEQTLRRVDEADVFDELERGVRVLLSDTGRVHVDRHSGLVQVTDYAPIIEQVEAYVDRVERGASRQVHLQASFIEVEVAQADRGLDWPRAVSAAGGEATSSASASILRAGSVESVERLVAALEDQGRVTVVASPGVVTLSSEPVVVGIRAAAEVARRALTLTVTPHIGATGAVTVSISPSLTRDGVPGNGVHRSSDVDTVARLRDGQTLALTGLALGLPDEAAARTDLVILLTPTVVLDGA